MPMQQPVFKQINKQNKYTLILGINYMVFKSVIILKYQVKILTSYYSHIGLHFLRTKSMLQRYKKTNEYCYYLEPRFERKCDF